MPAVGDPAPPLVLPDDTGTLQDLADQRGRWVVLFFYPKDFTPGCTTEACDFRDRSAAFHELGAVVWGISVLDSASKAGFKEKHALDYPLLADEDHVVAERFGVWVEKQSYGKTSMGIGRGRPCGRGPHGPQGGRREVADVAVRMRRGAKEAGRKERRRSWGETSDVYRVTIVCRPQKSSSKLVTLSDVIHRLRGTEVR
jgi:peroxiredoxin Q/BCP